MILKDVKALPIEVGVKHCSPSVPPDAINWGRLLKNFVQHSQYHQFAPPRPDLTSALHEVQVQKRFPGYILTWSTDIGIGTLKCIFWFESLKPEWFACLEIAAMSWKICTYDLAAICSFCHFTTIVNNYQHQHHHPHLLFGIIFSSPKSEFSTTS